MAEGAAGSYIAKFIAAALGVGVALGAGYFLLGLAFSGEELAAKIIFFCLLGGLPFASLLGKGVGSWFATGSVVTLVVTPLWVLISDNGFDNIWIIAAAALIALAILFFFWWRRDRRRSVE